MTRCHVANCLHSTVWIVRKAVEQELVGLQHIQRRRTRRLREVTEVARYKMRRFGADSGGENVAIFGVIRAFVDEFFPQRT